MNPLISVIVPVFNVQKYLPKCVDSILGQTYSNLEIFLVDDGCTDLCGKICDEYAERDSRITVIHKENGGIGSARNLVLEMATGEYVIFVDSDDYMSLNAIKVLYERMISDNSDMAIGKHTDVYEDGSQNDTYCSWIKDEVLSGYDIFLKMSEEKHFAVSAWSKLYKKTVLDGIRYPELKCGEDLWVFPEIVEKCKIVSVVDSTVYYYFQRSNSIMNKKSEISKYDELSATLNMSHYLWHNGFEASAYKWYERCISKAVRFNKKRDAIKLFEKYFNRLERKKLIKNNSIKTKLKFLSLYFPFLFKTVQLVKNAKAVFR